VANEQRRAIYTQRDDILSTGSIRENVTLIHDDVVDSIINAYIPPLSLDEQWDIAGLEQVLQTDFGMTFPVQLWLDEDSKLDEEGVRARLRKAILQAWLDKRERMGDDTANQLEKQVMLQIIDRHWKDHLAAMDYLRKGIHLRGYAQKNPEQEYKREAFQLFEQLINAVKLELIQTLARLHVPTAEEVAAMEAQREAEAKAMALHFDHADAATAEAEMAAVEAGEPLQTPVRADEPQTFVRDGAKVGRNDPCPCGSGKKFKHCHGQLA